MESVATWVVTGVSLIATVMGVVFAWPQFDDWRRRRRSEGQSQGSSVPNEATVSSAKVYEGGDIRVGCIPFPPLISCGRDGVASGVYKTILDAVGEALGVGITYVPIRNDDARKRLEGGEIDVIACLLETPDRHRWANYVGAIYTMHVAAVVRADSDIMTARDLRRGDLRAAVVEGEVGATYAERRGMTRENYRVDMRSTDRVSSVFDVVLSGDADVAITDRLTCVDFVHGTSDRASALRILDENIASVECALLVRKADEQFADQLDAAVANALQKPDIRSAVDAVISKTRGEAISLIR